MGKFWKIGLVIVLSMLVFATLDYIYYMVSADVINQTTELIKQTKMLHTLTCLNLFCVAYVISYMRAYMRANIPSNSNKSSK